MFTGFYAIDSSLGQREADEALEMMGCILFFDVGDSTFGLILPNPIKF